MQHEKIAIIAGARTATGRFSGVLGGKESHELGSESVKGAIQRSGVPGHDIDEVIMGCIGQVGPHAYNARQVAIGAGLGEDTPAFNVNRLCGSGLQAVWSAAQQLVWGGSDFIVAGGNESMSNMPFLDFDARSGRKLGHRRLLDGTIAMLTDPFSGKHMGFTAENVARKFDVSRLAQDEFALESQRRAAATSSKAVFAEEILQHSIVGGDSADVDEHPRGTTTLDSLARLDPAFDPQGSVTAGNSSGINDGAAALVLGKVSGIRDRGLPALATIEHVSTAAMAPELMGYAPTLALRKLFAETGLAPVDIGVTELNEAFASQALAVIRDAKLNPESTNPYGGAIALGHPVGATGAILTLRVAMDLQRRDLEFGIVTMCIGGGQALAALLRRYPS
jgi:acetyl-CoA C-acetyltransferase